MADPKAAAAKQLQNIETQTGRTVADFATEIEREGIAKHGMIVTHLKTEHSLTHGHANALAHAIRDAIAGGVPSEQQLLDAQLAGSKSHLRPIIEELIAIAEALGSDVDVRIQRTAVSLRRDRQFANLQVPSASRVRLGLNLPNDLATHPGLEQATGMCTHQLSLADVGDIDDRVAVLIASAYNSAGASG